MIHVEMFSLLSVLFQRVPRHLRSEALLKENVEVSGSTSRRNVHSFSGSSRCSVNITISEQDKRLFIAFCCDMSKCTCWFCSCAIPEMSMNAKQINFVDVFSWRNSM